MQIDTKKSLSSRRQMKSLRVLESSTNGRNDLTSDCNLLLEDTLSSQPLFSMLQPTDEIEYQYQSNSYPTFSSSTSTSSSSKSINSPYSSSSSLLETSVYPRGNDSVASQLSDYSNKMSVKRKRNIRFVFNQPPPLVLYLPSPKRLN